ncbi:hypothetical protein Fmac_017430 [Flemingia macrophylla]|uniref:Uncharacterized protein n=1 Tax=Flemingia macrophylla TaxID=520843 RepID=A0ABD1M232_9FABA
MREEETMILRREEGEECWEATACCVAKISRWEPSYGHMAGSDYFNSIHYEERKHGLAGDICSELKQLEQKIQPTKPCQMPQFGFMP